MNKKTIITALLALFTLAGQAQTTDTIRVGMEMKLQNEISTNVFLMHRETTPMKGLPADTASFHLYENGGILCALGKGDADGTYFVCLDLNGDKDFTNDTEGIAIRGKPARAKLKENRSREARKRQTEGETIRGKTENKILSE